MEVQQKHCETQFKVLSTGDYILPVQLQASIDKIVEKEGYITHNILNRSISTSGGNYFAQLYEVDIEGKTADGDKETNLFIKNKMEDTEITILSIEECYTMENYFYGELSRVYDDMQMKANIPVEERYAMVKSYDTTNPDAIILENLAKKGFTTVHRMAVVPLKFAELSIQQLARFHGLSWALEKQHPEYYEKKIKNIKTPVKFDDDYQRFIDNMSTYTNKCVDEDMKSKLNKISARISQTLNKYYNENAGVSCCLCHGDYRTNNILVKEDGDDISEVIPVDYQIMFYGCPVMDFLFFIFLGTDQEFRKKHLDDLKNLYHKSLAKFLKYFDMDVESVYPRHEFEAQYKNRLEFGLFTCLMMAPLLFRSDTDIPDLAKQDKADLSITPDPKMNDRIRGLARFSKVGYFVIRLVNTL